MTHPFRVGNDMKPVDDVIKDMSAGLGFDRIEKLEGSTFKDSSTVIVIPTRGSVNWRVVQAWQQLIAPMNTKRAILFAVGDEVGIAYNNLIENVLKHPELGKWKYVLTLEDDNIPPGDAHIRLLESIEFGPKFDAVSGIYFTKGALNMPQAYGDPDVYRATGALDFKPRDIRIPLQRGEILEVNGIAMGCALWRMSMFRDIPKPWFVTVADVIPEKGACAFTQDLYFCERAKRAGKRLAVDMRVKVGHIDISDGTVY